MWVVTSEMHKNSLPKSNLSRCIRKSTTCISKNKGAEQLFSNYIIPCPLKFEISSFEPGSVTTGRFVSDLVGNPDCLFSQTKAHIQTI